MNVRVDGQLIFNTGSQVVSAAVRGLGLACLPMDVVHEAIDDGRLVRVLADWCPRFRAIISITQVAASNRPLSPCWLTP